MSESIMIGEFGAKSAPAAPLVDPILELHRGPDGRVAFSRKHARIPDDWEDLGSVPVSRLRDLLPEFREQIQRDAYFGLNTIFEGALVNRAAPPFDQDPADPKSVGPWRVSSIEGQTVQVRDEGVQVISPGLDCPSPEPASAICAGSMRVMSMSIVIGSASIWGTLTHGSPRSSQSPCRCSNQRYRRLPRQGGGRNGRRIVDDVSDKPEAHLRNVSTMVGPDAVTECRVDRSVTKFSAAAKCRASRAAP
jgi:hypothetical protein